MRSARLPYPEEMELRMHGRQSRSCGWQLALLLVWGVGDGGVACRGSSAMESLSIRAYNWIYTYINTHPTADDNIPFVQG